MLKMLRALPRETASPDFTARVLARLDQEVGTGAGNDARIFGLPRLTLPAAVLAATLAVAASLSLQETGMAPSAPGAPKPASPAAAASLAPLTRIASQAFPKAPLRHFGPAIRTAGALRASNRTRSELAAALSEIRADHSRLDADMRLLREAGSSTLYLGGDEDMDVVVHLDQVREPPDRQPDPPPYPFD
jgi:hypothetical protein